MLPSVKSYDEVSLDGPFCLVAVAGFEDRASAVFDKLTETGHGELAAEGILIEYQPYDQRNDVQAIEQGMASLNIDGNDLKSAQFDRRDPDVFVPEFRHLISNLDSDHVLLDISGMSKFLIMVALEVLFQEGISVTIFYAEAEVYYPEEDDFQRQKDQSGSPDETPAFLTSGIYGLVTSKLFSSVAKSGQPLVAIAFPTFNYRELMALASELSPHLLVCIEGERYRSEYEWRRDAIQWLNREISSHMRTESRVSNKIDYKDTIRTLREVYRDYSDAYRLVVSPTGSKMQTVGVALFRRIHPDIHVVYPVATQFSETYTEGYRKCWSIDFASVDDELLTYGGDTDERISQLREKVNDLR